MRTFNHIASVGLVSALLVFSTPGAFAHTELISTTPVAMSVISEKPEKIVLSFSEAPILAGSFIQIEQPSGTVLGKAKPKLAGTALVTPWLPEIQPGEVLVRWRAVADDGHVSNGTFNFTFKQSAPSQSPTPMTAESNSSRDTAIWAAGIGLIILLVGIFATTRRRK